MAIRKSDTEEQRPGIAVDAQGGQIIDPSKNVEDVVRELKLALAEFRVSDQRLFEARIRAAEAQFLSTLREHEKYQNFARAAGEKYEAAARHAETLRVNELASTRKEYENTIRDMLAKSVETTSTLVSTQLVQIQATFDKRVSQLEAYQFTQAGKSSVADPALNSALTSMASSIHSLSKSDDTAGGRREGITSMGAIVLGAAGLISVGIAAATFLATHH